MEEEDGREVEDEKHLSLEKESQAVAGGSPHRRLPSPQPKGVRLTSSVVAPITSPSMRAVTSSSTSHPPMTTRTPVLEWRERMRRKGVSHLPDSSHSLSSRVQRLSVGHHTQLAPPLGDGSEDGDEEMKSSTSVPNASLYCYPSFENIDHFDSDDLRRDGVFVLVRLGEESKGEGAGKEGEGEELSPAVLTLHVWFGEEVEVREGFESLEGWAEAIAIEVIQQFPVLKRDEQDNVKVVVEQQGQESELWWDAFIEG